MDAIIAIILLETTPLQTIFNDYLAIRIVSSMFTLCMHFCNVF
jgi:hypothetical protein